MARTASLLDAYDGFDEFIRVEFPKRHPGWVRFGEATSFDSANNHFNRMYLLSGDVPDVKSQADAEHMVARLMEEVAR